MEKAFSFLLLAIVALSLISLTGCDSSLKNEETHTSSEESEQLQITGNDAVDEKTKEKITRECLKIAESYKDLYLSSTKESSPYSEDDMIISSNDYDKIVVFLASQGISVTNMNDDETDTLLNPQSFSAFWQQVQDGKDASFTTYTLSSQGGLYYRCYDFKDGEKHQLGANLEWEANNNPQVTNISSTLLSFWDFTSKGNFLYEAEISPIWGMDGHGMLRIEPCDEKLLEYGQKYIANVGYGGNNLFVPIGMKRMLEI